MLAAENPFLSCLLSALINMAPLPSLAPSLWGAASHFTVALNSMKALEQQQEARDTPSNVQSAVFAVMNGTSKKSVVPAAPAEPGAIKMYSPEYYMTCALGGVVSCGATHTAVTPLVSGCSSSRHLEAAATSLEAKS